MPWALFSISAVIAASDQSRRLASGIVSKIVEPRQRPLRGDLALAGEDIDLVVMRRVQRRGGGRRHPGAIRARHRMADLLVEHVGHPVGHRPHALADLRLARQSASEADIDVAILIGDDPGLRLHVALAHHRPRFHRGMDLVPGAVEEAGIDEGDPVLRRADALLEVDRGAPLLIHDAKLHGVLRQAQRLPRRG